MKNNLISESVSLLGEHKPSPVKIVAPTIEQLQKDLLSLKRYIENKSITHVTAGSGEVRILRMDDMNVSAIKDNRMLVWDSGQGKFRFIDVPVASNLGRPTLVTSVDYAPDVNDFYIGVNSENIVTITLPNDVVNGKEYVIKDEAGHAQATPIVLIGNIDNNVAGAEIRVNNGSISLIYRNGWRII